MATEDVGGPPMVPREMALLMSQMVNSKWDIHAFAAAALPGCIERYGDEEPKAIAERAYSIASHMVGVKVTRDLAKLQQAADRHASKGGA